MTEAPDPVLSIGELSRASGLSVSALRFYDRAQVLAPAWVEQWSGYRRYSSAQVGEARMLAGMRRVQMPVAEMAATLESLRGGDVDAARDLLTAHLRRLEDGLEDARRQLAQLHTVLADPAARAAAPDARAAGLPAPTLHALLGAVRHAVGTDPQFPGLMGVLVEVQDDVTLVATDRYRMVVAGPWRRTGSSTDGTGTVLLPTDEADRLASWLADRDGIVQVSAVGIELVVRSGPETLRLAGLDEPFPDYRRVLEHDGATAPLEEERLRVALDREDAVVDLGGIAVDRGFLWEAVTSVPDGQVLLPADGVIAPLVVRSPAEDVLALVMPVVRDGVPTS